MIVFKHVTSGESAFCFHDTSSDPFEIFPAIFRFFNANVLEEGFFELSAAELAEKFSAVESRIHMYSGQILQESSVNEGFASLFVVGFGRPVLECSWFQRLSEPVKEGEDAGKLLGIAADHPLVAFMYQCGKFTLNSDEYAQDNDVLTRKLLLAGVFNSATPVAGAVFAFVGSVFALGVPALLQALGEQVPFLTGIRLFGGFFMALGLFIFFLGLLPLLASNLWNRKVLCWWGNFLGGMAGAASFGVPATLLLPAWLFASYFRQDLFTMLPEELAKWSFIYPLNFVIGLITLLAMYLIGIHSLRYRPRMV